MEDSADHCLPSAIAEKLNPLLALGTPDWSLFENSKYAKFTLVFTKPVARQRSHAKRRRDVLRAQTKYLSSRVHAETQTSDVPSMDLSCSLRSSSPMPSPVVPTPSCLELSPCAVGLPHVDDAVVPDSPMDSSLAQLPDEFIPAVLCSSNAVPVDENLPSIPSMDLSCSLPLSSPLPSPVVPTPSCLELSPCAAGHVDDAVVPDSPMSDSSPAQLPDEPIPAGTPQFVPMDFDCYPELPAWKMGKKKKKKKNKKLSVSTLNATNPVYVPDVSVCPSRSIYAPDVPVRPPAPATSPVPDVSVCPSRSIYAPEVPVRPPTPATSPVYSPVASVLSPPPAASPVHTSQVSVYSPFYVTSPVTAHVRSV